MIKRFLGGILIFNMSLGLIGCGVGTSNAEATKPIEAVDSILQDSSLEDSQVTNLDSVDLPEDEAFSQEDIIILYTNDVHCAVSENIGYAGLAAYKEECYEQTDYVALVDAGDFIWGGSLGEASRGQAIIELMEAVGYDLCVPGNHEYEYGKECFDELVDMSGVPFIACNYDGLDDYMLITYGDRTVAFVGVTTPIYIGGYGDSYYERVQQSVDEARAGGADYVILVAHLGDKQRYGMYSSIETARNTSGIDVILDGHAHNVIDGMLVSNLEGKDVIISSTGTRLEYIGRLTIDGNGVITQELIADYEGRDSQIEALIYELTEKYE